MTDVRPAASVHGGPWWLVAVLAAALLARLAVLYGVEPATWVDGSDARYYLREAWRLAHGDLPAMPRTAPLYVQMLSLAWLAFPGTPLPTDEVAIPVGLLHAVRFVQVGSSLVMAAVLALLAARTSGHRRAALVVLVGVGLGPAFVIEPFRLLTESLALACMAVALSAWLVPGRTTTRAVLAGLAWGLATLTRPVMFGVPWLLAAHDAWRRRRGCRQGPAAHGVIMLASLVLTVLPWLVSLRATTGSWLPEGLTSNLWIGSVGDGRWTGTAQTDALRQGFARGPDDYVGEAWRAVRDHPVAWVRTRAGNLGAALVQPHLAPDMGGPSARQAVAGWMRGETPSVDVLRAVLGPAGLVKLLLYAWHWTALVLGIAGIWSVRRRDPRVAGGLAIAAIYFVGVHGLLTALPRYLLPMQLPLWVGVALWCTREPWPAPHPDRRAE